MQRQKSTEWFKRAFGQDYLKLYAHRNISEAEKHIRFVIEKLDFDESHKILDLGCGFARHSRLFAKAGYDVVGLDLSHHLLQRAKNWEKGRLKLVRGDMLNIPFGEKFDRVTSFFTSFGYFESDEKNQTVLNEIVRVLKPGGLLFFDYMNSAKVVEELVARDEQKNDGICMIQQRSYDPKRKRIEKEISICDEDGERCYFESVRAYDYSELMEMFELARLSIVDEFGDYDGNPYNNKSKRLILIGRK